MTHEVQTALETAKKALFFLNEALCKLSTSKPNDLLHNVPCSKNTPEPIDTLRYLYRSINNGIDHCSSIRDILLEFEVYNLTIRPTVERTTVDNPVPHHYPVGSPIHTGLHATSVNRPQDIASPIPPDTFAKHSLPPEPEDTFENDDSISPWDDSDDSEDDTNG